MGKFTSFVKTTIAEMAWILTSKQKLKSLYGVSLYRNAIYLVLNSAINALGGFLFWIIAVKLYSTESIGLASAAIAAIGLLTSVSNLGLNYGLIRFLPGSGEKSRDMLNSCITITGILSVALALVFLAGLALWSPALLPLREHWVFVIAFVMFTAAQNLYGIVQAVFIATLRTGFGLSQSSIVQVLRFASIVPLAVFVTLGVFYSWGIAVLVAGAVGVLLFLPKVQPGYRALPIVKISRVNDIFKYSLKSLLSNQLQIAPSSIIPLMVVNLLGAEQNAYFYIGWIMGTTVLTIPAAISSSLFAEGSNQEQKLDNQVKRSFKFLLLLLVPVVIVILLLADKLLLLFGTAYSQNAAVLVRLLVISAVPCSVNSIYLSIKRVQMKMKNVVIMTGFIAAATLGLSYFLLPSMGITGVGVAWLGSQVVVALWVGIGLLIKSKVKWSR